MICLIYIVLVSNENICNLESDFKLKVMMRKIKLVIALGILLLGVGMASASEKHRIIVLTDIENEPDDAMSLVRFLTYSNQWDVEGLIATTSVHQKRELATWRIKEIVEAYGKVQPNLLKHEPGYPTACIP